MERLGAFSWVPLRRRSKRIRYRSKTATFLRPPVKLSRSFRGSELGGGLNNVSFERCQFTGDLTATAESVHVEATDNGLITNINFSRCIFEVPIAGAVVFASVQRSALYNTWTGDLAGNPNTAPLITITKSAIDPGAIASSEIVINVLQTDIGQAMAGLETINADASSRDIVCIACIIESINNGGPGANPITCINCNVSNVAGDPVTQISASGAFITPDVQVFSGATMTARMSSVGALGGVWFQPYAATQDGNSYALLASSALLLRVNGPTNGSLSMRVGDTDFLNLDPTTTVTIRMRRLPFWFDPGTSVAPAAPATGFTYFIDVADNRLKVIGSSGTVTPIAVP